MKKVILLGLLLNSVFKIFSQQGVMFNDPEDYIEYIEDIKNQIETVKNDSGANGAIIRNYRKDYSDVCSSLEGKKFLVSSSNGTLDFYISDYDIEKQCWEIVVKSNLYENRKLFNQKVYLPYNVFSGKRFVPVEKMSQRQKYDYERTVDLYDGLLRTSGIILDIEIKYSFRRWIGASEYRVIPEEIIFSEITSGDFTFIYKVDRKNKTTKEELNPVAFKILPEREIRSSYQIRAETDKCNQILEKEKITGSFEAEEIEEVYDEETQSGRRALFFDAEIRDMEFQTVTGSLIWGHSDYTFGGIVCGYEIESMEKTAVYDFGGVFGFNFSFLRIFRPYVQSEILLKTDNHFIAKPGAGLDLKLGHFLITGCANYNFDFNLTPFINNFSIETFKQTELEKYFTWSIGMGVTW